MRKSREGMRDTQVTDEIIEEAEDISPSASPRADEGSVENDGGVAVASDDPVGDLQREITLERDKYLRLAAEFDNFRKRMTRERIEAEARGQGELVRRLLDPLDDVARFAHVDPAVTDSATLVEGVAMVEKKLDKSLRAAGLETVNPAGEKFDPALHEAVATQPTDDPELDHTVAQVYQVGYTFKGQLLRPARVVVRQHQ
ncbi:MAG TPA: nucleotide exchange factor GrpE [Gemmatimonadaceae bacterium]